MSQSQTAHLLPNTLRQNTQLLSELQPNILGGRKDVEGFFVLLGSRFKNGNV